MKKDLKVGMAAVLFWLLFISVGFCQEVGPNSDQYIIGPQDVLYIHVWKEEAFTRTVPVRPDGKISLPLIEEIPVSGMTPLQLKEMLVERLKEFIESPTVSVIVTEINSLKVYVSGQVKGQGIYPLKGETHLAEVLIMAGGFTEWANQKKILIIRKEKGKESRMTVNYKKFIKDGDSKSNVLLKPGDIIVVP